MDIKRILIVFVTCLLCKSALSQGPNVDYLQSEEFRENSDTSKTAYTTKIGESQNSEEELNRLISTKETYDDQDDSFNSSSGLMVEGVPEKKNETDSSNVKEDSNIIILTDLESTPYDADITPISKTSNVDLDITALALAADCSPLKSSGSHSLTVVTLEDYFFVIPIRSSDLPPMPTKDIGIKGIHGIDINQNCVRDDIEHYVFNKYPETEQEQIRLNLYAHAIWLNFFLTKPISELTIQGITRQNIKTGKCMNVLLGEEPGRLARGDLFAHLHNTEQRTQRYFENMEAVRGFLIKEDITGTCL